MVVFLKTFYLSIIRIQKSARNCTTQVCTIKLPMQSAPKLKTQRILPTPTEVPCFFLPVTTLPLTLTSSSSFAFVLHITGIIQYILFGVWLLSHIISVITLLQVVIKHSFSLLYSISLCEYATINVSIPVLLGI